VAALLTQEQRHFLCYSLLEMPDNMFEMEVKRDDKPILSTLSQHWYKCSVIVE